MLFLHISSWTLYNVNVDEQIAVESYVHVKMAPYIDPQISLNVG